MPRTFDSGVAGTPAATGLQQEVRAPEPPEAGTGPRSPGGRALFSELVSLGVRMTSQRRLIVGLIQDARAPLDAATLLELARKQDATVDRATVYRTLALLRKNG